MKFSIAAAALSLVAAVSALPSTLEKRACPSTSDAQTIISRYAAAQAVTSSDLGGPKKTLRKILAPDFQETSESLNTLIGFPAGSLTFANKKTYINAVLTATPANLETLQIHVGDCNYITWYWVEQTLDPSNPVRGINILEINDNLQISEVWLELDTIAWQEATGTS